MKPPTPISATAAAAIRRRGVIAMLISVSGFSVNTCLLKHLGTVEKLPPLLPLLFRAGIGMLIVLTLLRGGSQPTRLRPVFTDKLLFWRGLTGVLGTAAYYWTVPPLGAGKATLLCNTYVVFAAIIAAVWLGEKLTARRIGWLALALTGIALLTGPNGKTGVWTVGLADGIAIGGAVMAASAVVLIRKLSADHSIGTIYLAQCVWIFLPVLPLTYGHLADLSGADWTWLIVAATAAGFGQLAMNEGYRCLTVSTGAALQMLWPVVTAFAGLAWFDERFTALQIVGAATILTATWFISTQRA